jgi:hypothetical protein
LTTARDERTLYTLGLSKIGSHCTVALSCKREAGMAKAELVDEVAATL